MTTHYYAHYRAGTSLRMCDGERLVVTTITICLLVMRVKHISLLTRGRLAILIKGIPPLGCSSEVPIGMLC